MRKALVFKCGECEKNCEIVVEIKNSVESALMKEPECPIHKVEYLTLSSISVS